MMIFRQFYPIKAVMLIGFFISCTNKSASPLEGSFATSQDVSRSDSIVIELDRELDSGASDEIVIAPDSQNESQSSEETDSNLSPDQNPVADTQPSGLEVFKGNAARCVQIQAQNQPDQIDGSIYCRIENEFQTYQDASSEGIETSWSIASDYPNVNIVLSPSDLPEWDIKARAETGLILSSMFVLDTAAIVVELRDAKNRSLVLNEVPRELIGENCDSNADLSFSVPEGLVLLEGNGLKSKSTSGNSEYFVTDTKQLFLTANHAVIYGTDNVHIEDSSSTSFVVLNDDATYINNTGEAVIYSGPETTVVPNENKVFRFHSSFEFCSNI